MLPALLFKIMESIETLNQRLIDHFGVDTNNGKPQFRIVWANDQTEKRMMRETANGVQLLWPEMREVPKYSYLKDLYVLERLVIVPEEQQKELAGKKLSYEPIWAYRDANNQPLPPIWQATKLVIDVLFAAMGKTSLRKYVDTEENTTPEGHEQRIDKLHAELFGNETEVGDALRYKEGVVVPNNYKGVE